MPAGEGATTTPKSPSISQPNSPRADVLAREALLAAFRHPDQSIIANRRRRSSRGGKVAYRASWRERRRAVKRRTRYRARYQGLLLGDVCKHFSEENEPAPPVPASASCGTSGRVQGDLKEEHVMWPRLLSTRALIARINRRLAPSFQAVRTSRGRRARAEVGLHYLVDIDSSVLLEKDVDLVELGRLIGALARTEDVRT